MSVLELYLLTASVSFDKSAAGRGSYSGRPIKTKVCQRGNISIAVCALISEGRRAWAGTNLQTFIDSFH